MTKERDLRMGVYNISANRYRELKYFCRQYREKQSRLRAMTEISSPILREGGRGGKTTDTTADKALQRAELEKDLNLMEQAAEEAGKGIAAYLISNAADGIPYEYLGAPCSRATFFRARRKFFWLLDQKK